MIGKLSGRLDWRGADQVLIDVRGVGYIVHVNDRTLAAMPAIGDPVALYTDLLVREDLLQMFGFSTLLDKEWHRLLTTVQGVGAKASMTILGALGAGGVARAIALGVARAIQAAQGVGPKLAQRIILELKAKAPGLMAAGVSLSAAAQTDDAVFEPAQARRVVAPSAAATASMTRAGHTADPLSALLNLGYPQGDAAQAVATISADAPDADTATLIRASLKLLAPR
ncbi:MAG: Holliday junction branch migration protein RuvA [Candidatus Saccharibacteria bacterium]|nr:Holliday junction branch migration protein RuvA [Pseudorhodobacter sp.]